MASKKKHLISFRTVLMILTVVLVIWVLYQNWGDIQEIPGELAHANIWVLLLLIPEQLFMYYACGQIFFTYLKHRRDAHRFSTGEKMRIATELNFVNHALPAGGFGGLAFLTYRLKKYDISAGQASFLYIFRYVITTVINYVQALVATVILLLMGAIPEQSYWVIGVALVMNMAYLGFLWFVMFVAGSKRRIEFFARTVAGVVNNTVRLVTFGKKRKILRDATVSRYFDDIHENVKIAKERKQYLKKPALWGVIYSFCEIGTYWIVAISLGRPELLAIIMVGEAIGSVFDGIVPYGLYELGMAGVMVALGVDATIAAIITAMTRVITLLFTIVSGAVPYYQAIRGRESGEKRVNGS